MLGLEEKLYLKVGRKEYDLIVSGKYNFIIGDSSTGKTELQHSLLQAAQGVPYSYSGFLPLIRFTDLVKQNWVTPQSIIVVDEDDIFGYNRNAIVQFARENSHCWILCVRSMIGELPTSVFDIYTMKRSGRYHAMKRVYGLGDFTTTMDTPSAIVCEDSAAGFRMVKEKFSSRVREITSAHSKDTVELEAMKCAEPVALAVDLCGYGYNVASTLDAISRGRGWNILCNQSFESQMLESRLLSEVIASHRKHRLIDLLEFTCEEEYYTQYVDDMSRWLYGRGYGKQYGTLCKELVGTRDMEWLLPQIRINSGLRRLDLDA